MRTSLTHPLIVSEVQAEPGQGQIGITFCPGKHQPDSMTGAWRRDLDIDLDAIRHWGAAAVVTLAEDHELSALKVSDLGQKVRERHMAWYHMPIEDAAIPSPEFEVHWAAVSDSFRARLRDGFNVLVHCKGGLGRAGTIAARLLVELGLSPRNAIGGVRQARPGAIETAEQEQYVLALREAPEAIPDSSLAAIKDRAVGALLGLAVGDAIGTTLEFTARDSYRPLTDMVGGGPFRLKPGQWTDDTALALALADSLAGNGGLDEADLMRRFVRWHEHGEYSCTGNCFDIGAATSRALSRWKGTCNPVAGSTDPQTAGNGSLMRLAPVAIRHWSNRAALRDTAARQSRTTHAAPEAIDACIAYAEVLADAIEGLTRTEVLRSRSEPYTGAIGTIMAGSWRGRLRNQIQASGYVAHSLEASLWSVGRSSSFEEAVLLAANLGEDADTTAAITGQLAGALYGADGIPKRWLDRLAWEPRIRRSAEALYQNSMH
jgi:ADP-ribosyl-[dinitrogen reductase] hydrolase